jgi:hypothetical protein
MTFSRPRCTVPAGFFALVLMLQPCFAAAATPEEVVAAEVLFEQARALVLEGKLAEACPKFEESQRLDPASGTLINLGDCYERQGRTASAWSAYLEAAASALASGNLEREKVARQRAEALRPTLPRITITVAEADVQGLEVQRDGRLVGAPQWGVEVPVDPGPHTIEARAPGRVPFRLTISAESSGPVVNVNVPPLVAEVAAPPAPKPAPPPASSGLGTQRTLAITSAGVGLVGVGLGTFFGLRSKSKHDESYDICPSDPCSELAGIEAMQQARTAGTISTVSFVVGGAALAAGGILWFTAKKAAEPVAELGIGPGRVEVRGRF